MPKPNIGRIVWYRTDGRNGLVYDLPAIINCTQETHPGDYPNGAHNPCPVPSSPTHVHLTVFTPGGVGTAVMPTDEDFAREPESDADFVGAMQMVPGTGTYVELDVPLDQAVDADPKPRSWRWPVMD